jgi:hypothetical protein
MMRMKALLLVMLGTCLGVEANSCSSCDTQAPLQPLYVPEQSSETGCSNECQTCSCQNICRTTFVPSLSILPRRPLHMPKTASEKGIEADFFASYTYQRSIQNDQLATCLFGQRTKLFEGSLIEDRTPGALLADNFGIPRDFAGTATFTPLLQTNTIDFVLELRSSRFCHWYAQVLAPIQHANWQISMCEKDITPDAVLETNFPAGYMSADACACVTDHALDGDSTFGDMHTPWSFGKMVFVSPSGDTAGAKLLQADKTALANLEFRVGYDFISDYDAHIGGYVLLQAPTGSSLNPRYFFHPVVGEGQHWKIGAGITAHSQLWKHGEHEFMAYLEGNLGHMFKKSQMRSFEFRGEGCCMNRYMLLKEFDSFNNFTGNLVNGIDFATRWAEVKINAVGEAKLELVYLKGRWQAALGYNLYGRMQEEVCIKSQPLAEIQATKRYGFKGCAGDYYWQYPTQLVDGVEVIAAGEAQAVPLNATQSNATACSCGSVDYAALLHTPAVGDTAGSVGVSYTQGGGANAVTQGTSLDDIAIAEQSVPPVTFAGDAIEVLDPRSGAMPSLMTQTVYGRVGYTADICGYQPEFILGMEGEFRQPDRCCTLSQFGIWLAGSLAF